MHPYIQDYHSGCKCHLFAASRIYLSLSLIRQSNTSYQKSLLHEVFLFDLHSISIYPSLCVSDNTTISNTTGTLSPSLTFGAPVTICTSFPSSSICTWQITSLSASGCFSILLIFPTMILSKFYQIP